MHFKKSFVSVMILGSLIFAAGGTAHGQVYYVQPGDSLYSIAARYGTTTSALTDLNALSSNQIYPGQALNIASKNSNKSNSFSYTVLPGDSLFLLAQKFGITVDAIKSSNNLSSNFLWVGKQLTIPAVKKSSSASTTSYIVKAGDSLFLIAQRYGVSVDAL
jgi:LysM repeat protein